jgi:glycosyltransferase involved in cell wall biosynthesis
MRVAFLDHAFVGVSGASVRVASTVRALARHGVEGRVVTTRSGRAWYADMGVEAEARTVTVVPALERIQERPAGYLPIYGLGLAKAMLRPPPACDVVVSSSDFLVDTLPAHAYRRRGRARAWVAMVHHLIDPPARRPGNALVNRLAYASQRRSFRLMARRADRVLVLRTPEGDRIRGALAEAGVPPARIGWMSNGIDPALLARPAPPPAHDALASGGLQSTRGGDDLVDVWARVAARRPGARLVVVGRDEPAAEDAFRQRARAALPDGALEVRPRMTREAYVDAVAASRVYLNPKHEEGWGIAVYEALALGVPVVTYDLPAFARLGDAVLRAPVGDRAAFAGHVARLLEDDALRRDLAARGRKAVEPFTWDAAAAEDLASFRAALEEAERA